MKERPILFSGPTVRAILEGRKSQTRKMVKAMSARQAEWLTPALIDSVVALDVGRWECGFGVSLEHPGGGPLGFVPCPFGAPGDRLWVRETWCHWPEERAGDYGEILAEPSVIAYRADKELPGLNWRPSIHMPRWASRITLEVTDVRVERLQAISEADARVEGVEMVPMIRRWRNYVRERESSGIGETVATARESFGSLWESLHSTESWAANPWVWVVSFRRLP